MTYPAKFRRALYALFASVCMAAVSMLPATAAADPAPLFAIDFSQVDPDTPGSLSMHYPTLVHDNVAPESVQVRAYRIAEMAAGYPAVPDISPYAAAVGWNQAVTHTSTSAQPTDWAGLADALAAYLQANSVQPDAISTIDQSGTAAFHDVHVGIYLVLTTPVTTATWTYTFAPSLIAVPTVDEGGQINYDVTSEAKTDKEPRPTHGVEYKITKHWNDGGNKAERPSHITVDLLRDGQLFEVVTLSAANGWVYSWSDEGGHQWKVSERVENLRGTSYVTSNTRVGETYIVTNTSPTPPPPRPRKPLSHTGSTSETWRIAGAVLLMGVGTVAGVKQHQRRSSQMEATNRG